MHLQCPQKLEVGKKTPMALVGSLVTYTMFTEDVLTVSPGCIMSCLRAKIISDDLSVI